MVASLLVARNRFKIVLLTRVRVSMEPPQDFGLESDGCPTCPQEFWFSPKLLTTLARLKQAHGKQLKKASAQLLDQLKLPLFL